MSRARHFVLFSWKGPLEKSGICCSVKAFCHFAVGSMPLGRTFLNGKLSQLSFPYNENLAQTVRNVLISNPWISAQACHFGASMLTTRLSVLFSVLKHYDKIFDFNFISKLHWKWSKYHSFKIWNIFLVYIYFISCQKSQLMKKIYINQFC